MSAREKIILAISWSLIVIVFLFSVVGGRWSPFGLFRGKVCIRLDDVQDHWMWQGQILLMDYCISQRVGMTIGIVSGIIGEDQRVTDRIEYGVNLGIFEIALHGWLNENYSRMDYPQQLDLIQRGKNKLENVFPDTTVVTFIPPMNEFNDDTLRACKEAGIQFISGTAIPQFPKSEGTLKHFPETVQTADYYSGGIGSNWIPFSSERIIEDIEDSLEKYSFAVVTLHPQQFYTWIDGSPEVIDTELFNDLVRVIDWIKNNTSPVLIRQLGSPSRFGVDSRTVVYITVGLLLIAGTVIIYRRKKSV
ncbi:MAG: polysaccharide deacetylase family protein [Candidatus Bathyarchaeota archaeon]|nr:MAG: polysaccharide deacetylase family protein [Candidatus Bathyarchaeota archaeon]